MNPFDIGPRAMWGLIATFMAVFIIIGILIYLYLAYCLYRIAGRHKIQNAWLAFIPIANLWVLLQIAGLPAWWMLIIVIGIIPVIGGLIALAGWIYILYMFLQRINQPWWWILIMVLLPVIGPIIAMSYFAFGTTTPAHKKKKK